VVVAAAAAAADAAVAAAAADAAVAAVCKDTRHKVALEPAPSLGFYTEHEYAPHFSKKCITTSTVHSDLRGWGTRGFSGSKVTFCLVFSLCVVRFALETDNLQ
jgi:hypothetical protein